MKMTQMELRNRAGGIWPGAGQTRAKAAFSSVAAQPGSGGGPGRFGRRWPEGRAGARASGGAFTLLELLVVIAILGILAALLLPALAGAKARALRIECTSNFKQFAAAFCLYAGDHQDAVLPNKDGPHIPLGQTWVEGWEGVPGPDCTNTLYLTRSLVGPYLGGPAIWRCPATRDPRVVGVLMPRVRTVSLNCFMGARTNRPGVAVYKKLGDAVQPGPADTLTFLDERIDTVNDGTFSMQWDFAASQPAAWVLRDKPTPLHQRGGVMAFADGHAEAHRWRDARTLDAPRNDTPMPGNLDVLWLQQHGTWRTP
jgi:prepilin-type N-terminal cleavage/methylation domain-containing protein/prepilin-type processing-associated H-X9-DG protein